MRTEIRWKGSLVDQRSSISQGMQASMEINSSASIKNQLISRSLSQVDSAKLCIHQPSQIKPSPHYSIKYLGITNGQIGVLSKRASIPFISPLDSCKNVPLTLINSSISHKTPSRILTKILEAHTPPPYVAEKIEQVAPKIIENNFPDPATYDEHIIHTYARPRGFIALHKERHDYNEPAVIIPPKHRNGVYGWKLSRPATAKVGKKATKSPQSPMIRQKTRQSQNLSEFHNEAYLKYLFDKQKAST